MINNDLHLRFCQNMKARRTELGLTQAELARKVGVSQPVIAQIEQGRNAPTLDTVSVIAKGLSISPEALLLFESVTT